MTIPQLLPYSEFWYNVCGIVGLCALFLVYLGYKTDKKQLHYTVIIRCTDYFREHFAELEKRPECWNKYVDFVNEELFYMQQGYIPDEVAREWLDGIIDHFPVFVDKKNYNTGSLIAGALSVNGIQQGLLKHHPRLQKAFDIDIKNADIVKTIFDAKSEVANPVDRGKLVHEILKNVQGYKFK